MGVEREHILSSHFPDTVPVCPHRGADVTVRTKDVFTHNCLPILSLTRRLCLAEPSPTQGAHGPQDAKQGAGHATVPEGSAVYQL